MLTPGCNESRYLAGAWNPKTNRLIHVEGERKNSLLFLELLHTLATKVEPSKVFTPILSKNAAPRHRLGVLVGLGAYNHAARHAAKTRSQIKPGIWRGRAWHGRAGQAFELVESGMVDRATANSSPRTATGHKQDDQIVKTKPLTRKLLAGSGSEPGANASPLFKEPAA